MKGRGIGIATKRQWYVFWLGTWMFLAYIAIEMKTLVVTQQGRGQTEQTESVRSVDVVSSSTPGSTPSSLSRQSPSAAQPYDYMNDPDVPPSVPAAIKKANASAVAVAHPSIEDIANAPERGSGVIVDAQKGLVLTARHVIYGVQHLGKTDTLDILTADHKRLKAKIIAVNPNQANNDPMQSFPDDLALLQIQNPPANLVAAPIAQSPPKSGDDAWVIGSPICRLVATPDNCGVEQFRKTQITEAGELTIAKGGINPKTGQAASPAKGGNSGGPLFNDQGELEGIVVMGNTEREDEMPISQQVAGSVPLQAIQQFLQTNASGQASGGQSSADSGGRPGGPPLQSPQPSSNWQQTQRNLNPWQSPGQPPDDPNAPPMEAPGGAPDAPPDMPPDMQGMPGMNRMPPGRMRGFGQRGGGMGMPPMPPGGGGGMRMPPGGGGMGMPPGGGGGMGMPFP
jgi:S1-C subfamily serine protease